MIIASAKLGALDAQLGAGALAGGAEAELHASGTATTSFVGADNIVAAVLTSAGAATTALIGAAVTLGTRSSQQVVEYLDGLHQTTRSSQQVIEYLDGLHQTTRASQSIIEYLDGLHQTTRSSHVIIEYITRITAQEKAWPFLGGSWAGDTFAE